MSGGATHHSLSLSLSPSLLFHFYNCCWCLLPLLCPFSLSHSLLFVQWISRLQMQERGESVIVALPLTHTLNVIANMDGHE